jgi:hypothetical protein
MILMAFGTEMFVFDIYFNFWCLYLVNLLYIIYFLVYCREWTPPDSLLCKQCGLWSHHMWKIWSGSNTHMAVFPEGYQLNSHCSDVCTCQLQWPQNSYAAWTVTRWGTSKCCEVDDISSSTDCSGSNECWEDQWEGCVDWHQLCFASEEYTSHSFS